MKSALLLLVSGQKVHSRSSYTAFESLRTLGDAQNQALLPLSEHLPYATASNDSNRQAAALHTSLATPAWLCEHPNRLISMIKPYKTYENLLKPTEIHVKRCKRPLLQESTAPLLDQLQLPLRMALLLIL